MSTDNRHISVLDHGYVRLVDHMGSDLTPANSARASFGKRSETFTERDARLLAFLVNHGHTSPFRHAVVQFEVKAPMMIANQWRKYRVGSLHTPEGVPIPDYTDDPLWAWNESSRRYVTEEPQFYVPKATEWRSAPESKKQGSGDAVSPMNGSIAEIDLRRHIARSVDHYETAMRCGICAEQARLFLPAYAMYVTWYWTASLQSVCHFLNERLGHDAQSEIRDYASAVYSLVKPLFPVSVDHFVKHDIAKEDA
jgi:thymidylate synthase (FAD)